MADNCDESKEERARRLVQKQKQRQRTKMQPLLCEGRGEVDECEREEAWLAKQRKRMAALRNDHTRKSARLHRNKNKFYCSSLVTTL